MSPRAAWRLEHLGFTQVFDYVAGKADWLANGLPSEGTRASELRAADAMRTVVVTCSLTERLGAVRERMRAGGREICIVVTDDGVVLGRLRAAGLDTDSGSSIEAVMEAGPTTIRPNTGLASVVKRMQARKVEDILVTTTGGRLLGVLYRQDAEQRLNAMQR